MKILGIDPGSTRIGFGCIINKPLKQGGVKLLSCGLLPIKQKKLEGRLLETQQLLNKLIKKIHPDLFSIEKIYFGKNRKTALEIAHFRGVLMAEAVRNKIKIVEYSPNEVKLTITGYGFSDKKAVARMVAKILKLEKIPSPDDITDAIALALTAIYRRKFTGLDK